MEEVWEDDAVSGRSRCLLVTLSHVEGFSTIPRLMPDSEEEARVLATHGCIAPKEGRGPMLERQVEETWQGGRVSFRTIWPERSISN